MNLGEVNELRPHSQHSLKRSSLQVSQMEAERPNDEAESDEEGAHRRATESDSLIK